MLYSSISTKFLTRQLCQSGSQSYVKFELEMDYTYVQWSPPSLLFCQCLSTCPPCEAVWTELLGSLAFLLPPQSTLSMPHNHYRQSSKPIDLLGPPLWPLLYTASIHASCLGSDELSMLVCFQMAVHIQ